MITRNFSYQQGRAFIRECRRLGLWAARVESSLTRNEYKVLMPDVAEGIALDYSFTF